MNSAPFLRIGVVATGLLAVSAVSLAEDKAPAQENDASADKTVSEKAAPGPTEVAPAQAAASTNGVQTAEAVLQPASSAMLDLSTREAAGATSISVRQVGPEPTVTEPVIKSLDERGGALRHLAKEPKAGNFLQLINPFAPMSLGEGGRFVNEWRPIDGPAPLPRAFRDESTHEPLSILIGWP